MIKIEKGEEPAILVANAANWEQVLRDHEAAGTSPSDSDLNRYNHAEVKQALFNETHAKCAYCECKLRHVYYGDIEHITPKKLGPEYRYRWSNLTLACKVCNTNKGTLENLVDPNLDEPAEHFIVEGPAILPHPDSVKGRITEVEIELNRQPLVERRTERIRKLHAMLTLALKETDPELKEVLFNELKIKETRSNVEFAAMSRAFVKSLIDRGLIPAD